MSLPPSNANDIVRQIESGKLRPMGNVVARVLLEKIGFQHEIITAYDLGDAITPLPASDPLWIRIFALPNNEQGAWRLVANLARPDGELNSYDADFFIEWARQQGVPENEIVEAFHRGANRS